MESLGVNPILGGRPIEVRRSAQMGMFAALFAAQPETWPVFMAWLEEHAPAHARMVRASGTTPDTFRAAADVLAGVDLGLHMLGFHETLD
jgi:hypothetical protein